MADCAGAHCPPAFDRLDGNRNAKITHDKTYFPFRGLRPAFFFVLII